ncbi:hypothetical protein LSTR_LSTR014754 [Laodelphax striatellus]|uniref:Ras-GEF domain-containing protein n=1 Tax=Laodelphax striatellus TaxID=195883 RepID=A0A482WLV2_LAOST|nr:hypothetical protein LSTR_LSTR014754 [Laodelphax striatellus]
MPAWLMVVQLCVCSSGTLSYCDGCRSRRDRCFACDHKRPFSDRLTQTMYIAKQRSRRERHPSQYDNVPLEQTQSCTTINQAGIDHPLGSCSPDHASQHPPPPLPLKKKHSQYLTDSRSVSPGGYDSEGGVVNDLPPALPPKQRARPPPPPPTTAPASPTPALNNSLVVRISTPEPATTNTHNKEFSSVSPQRSPLHRGGGVELSPIVTNGGTSCSPALEEEEDDDAKSVAPPDSPLAELDMTRFLVFKKTEEDGPDIRGGHPDALIIHATKASKNDFLYQEAFLTTYRTFLSPLECIEKLCRRHQRFCTSSDVVKQRAAREAFSLLVRVVSELTYVSERTDRTAQIRRSEARKETRERRKSKKEKKEAGERKRKKKKKKKKKKRRKTEEERRRREEKRRIEERRRRRRRREKKEKKKKKKKKEKKKKEEEEEEKEEEEEAALGRMMARSRILEQQDAKDRERYVVKFIKIMKHLRKINNFNSYLALLSALDSAPIRRLEWQKQITEGLKEYCALIDSSSSFRAYRQALAETQPPCIPYIGLVLQDLTFVHIGNNDHLSDGVINFSKRWQQFNIVENMKRFKKGIYKFEKNERIIGFFNNFNDCLCEEAMWQISESIKPRGTKKTIQ